MDKLSELNSYEHQTSTNPAQKQNSPNALPIDDKTATIVEQHFDNLPTTPPRNSKLNPYCTPEKKKYHALSAPPPAPKRTKANTKKLFGGANSNIKKPFGGTKHPLTHNHGYKKKDFKNGDVAINGAYKHPFSSKLHLCIQQPPQEQSCGTGAALMLLSESMNIHQLKDSFWDWYFKRELLSHTELIERLKIEVGQNEELQTSGCQVQGSIFHYEDTRKFLDEKPDIEFHAIHNFEEDLLSKLVDLPAPFIISIQNPVLEGHWILVDHIELGKGVYIRDPYQGIAYKIGMDEFLTNLTDEGGGVQVVYFQSTDS